MNFLFLSDESYVPSLFFSIKGVYKFYPNAQVYLYDWGISKSSKQLILDSFSRVVFIDWSIPIKQNRHELFNNTEIYNGIKRNLLEREERKKGLLFKIKFFLKYRGRFQTFLHKRICFEHVLIEKVRCMQDCLQKIGPEPLVYLDADAILCGQVSDVFTSDMDVGITVRRTEEISFRTNWCKVFNVGVVFFGPNEKARNAFITDWLTATQQTTEFCQEQTALARMLENKHKREMVKPHISFEYLTRSGESANIKVLHCDTYNFCWIEELIAGKASIDPIRVLHFKGSRHHLKNFKRFWHQIEPLLPS